MKEKQFNKIKALITFYIAMAVAMAVSLENNWLAVGGVFTGALSLWLLRKTLSVKTTDERTQHISHSAAAMTYSIMSTAMAAISLLLIFVFKNQPYVQSVGVILSYITLLMIGIYSLLYRYYLNQES